MSDDWGYEPKPPFRVAIIDDIRGIRSRAYPYIELSLQQALAFCDPPLSGHMLVVADDVGTMIFGYNYSEVTTPTWFGVHRSYQILEDLQLVEPFRLAAWEAMARLTCEGDR